MALSVREGSLRCPIGQPLDRQLTAAAAASAHPQMYKCLADVGKLIPSYTIKYHLPAS